MTQTQSNENVIQQMIRAFTQRGIPTPSTPLLFAGLDEQYLMVGDISRPDRGGVNAINVGDPRQRLAFRRTGVTVDPPDIPSNTVTFKQKINGVPWYRFKLNCPINIYESEGPCPGDPSDPLNGWTILNVLSMGLSSDKTYKGRTPFDSSDESTADVNFSWMGDVYTLGGIALGEVAAVDVTTEVVDVVYGSNQNCADCGPVDDGTKRIYALQQTAGGSSAVNAKVLYSVDGGASWATSAITGIGVGSIVTAIDIVGSYLVVLVSGENAYYVSSINQFTGVPGAWTKVTTGFVALKNPTDIYVESPSRIYFSGLGGYIYLSQSILAGVTVLNAGNTTTNNLNRIMGQGTNLLAVGASNTIIKSGNRGVTWQATTASVTGTLKAAAILGPLRYYVGGNNAGVGLVSYTEDGGETWTSLSLPGAALIDVLDIVWPTQEAGYIAATRSGPTAALFQTTFGGRIWGESNTSRFPPTLPTFGRPNRIAYPNVSDLQVAANNIAVAGLGGGLVDGVLYVGQAPVL